MEARIEHRWEIDEYQIWFHEDKRVFYPLKNEWKSVAEGTTPIEPSLSLRMDAMEALLREAGKVIPATHATERHLNREMAMVDRLFKLVDEGWVKNS